MKYLHHNRCYTQYNCWIYMYMFKFVKEFVCTCLCTTDGYNLTLDVHTNTHIHKYIPKIHWKHAPACNSSLRRFSVNCLHSVIMLAMRKRLINIYVIFVKIIFKLPYNYIEPMVQQKKQTHTKKMVKTKSTAYLDAVDAIII